MITVDKTADPETELRAIWTAKGVPPERQEALIREIEAKARPEYLAGLFGPYRPSISLERSRR